MHPASLVLPLLLSALAPARVPAAPPCPWCNSSEAPATLTATGRLAPVDEPGVPLEITGTVYQPDGRTPAAGVLVYAAQAHANGALRRDGNAGEGREHPDLRAWLRTDARGHYRFITVRPARVRGGTEPANIMMTVQPRGGRESLIDPVEFDDDPSLTAAVRARRAGVGGSGIVRAVPDARGVLHAVRDITLPRGA